LDTITFKVDEELKKSMEGIEENWSAFLREAIRRRVEHEEQRKAAEKLLQDLKAGKRMVPSGFINSTVREIRDTA
jgi:predicted DNA-binding protein